MPKARFTARWSPQLVRDVVEKIKLTGKLPRGTFMVFPDERWWDGIGIAMRELDRRQQDRVFKMLETQGVSTAGPKVIDCTYELDLTMDILYGHRTLDQNALMWWLYTVLARVKNASHYGVDMVTKEQLYGADMERFADIYVVTVRAAQLPALRRWGWTWKMAVPVEGTDQVTVHLMETSSKWTTVRMDLHIEYLFDCLAAEGIPARDVADVSWWWKQWRQHLNDSKTILHTEPMTAAEYKALNPYCEGCGRFIGPQGEHKFSRGDVHHISSKGSGITWADEKNLPADWMHLCNFPFPDGTRSCHDVWNSADGGPERFVELNPHTRHKVMTAMKRIDRKDPVETDQVAVTDDGQGKLGLEGEMRTQDFDDAPGREGGKH